MQHYDVKTPLNLGDIDMSDPIDFYGCYVVVIHTDFSVRFLRSYMCERAAIKQNKNRPKSLYTPRGWR